MKKSVTPDKNVLIGKFFHSLNRQNQVHWQGVVLGSPEPGWYLLQLFEWGMGEPSVIRLARFDEMRTWLFYDSASAMKRSYEDGIAREGGLYRKEIPRLEPPTPVEKHKTMFDRMREAAK